MTKRLVVLAFALAFATISCGGGGEEPAAATPSVVGPADAGQGEAVYNSACVACHGEMGLGIDGLGKPIPGSEFMAGQTDPQLVEFIMEGRSADHPDNTTGIEMPAWAGNTNLTEQDLVDVVAFMRTL